MDILTIEEGFPGQKMIVLPMEVRNTFSFHHSTSGFYPGDMGFYPRARYHHRQRQTGAKDHIFIYCVSGKGTIEIRKEVYEISPGQVFIIPKNTEHKYYADKTAPWSIYWMHFNGRAADEIIATYLSLPHPVIKAGIAEDSIQLFEHIYKLLENNRSIEHIIYASVLIAKFISDFVFQDVLKSTLPGTNRGLTEEIIAFLNNNLDKNFKADELALLFNYSRSHILNQFKKDTGYSLLYFFNLKKIQKACEYLQYSDLSIKEIAFHLGFEDPLYFSRIFKKYMGRSPRSYRNG